MTANQHPEWAAGRSIGLLIAAVAVVLTVILGIAVWVVHTRSSRPQPRAALTAEGREYLQHIEIAEVKVSAATNFLGDMVTYVDAKMTNTGARSVRRLDLRLEFSDMLNQVVLREIAYPLTARMPPLKAGESRPFRVTFEKMPAEWNQAPPAITVVGLQL